MEPPHPGDVGRRALAHDALADGDAPIHEHDPVGQLLQIAEEVAGDDQCHPLGAQVPDQSQELGPTRRVEPGGRLVEQQDGGLMDQRTGECQALLLAPGQDVYRPVRPLLQAHELEHGLGPLRGECLRQCPGPTGEAQVLPGRQVLVEAEGVRDPAEDASDLPGLRRRVVSADPHEPLVGGEQGRQDQ